MGTIKWDYIVNRLQQFGLMETQANAERNNDSIEVNILVSNVQLSSFLILYTLEYE